MPKKIGTIDRSILLNAALPQKTKSYTVITHGDVIDTIEKGLQTNNFVCEAEEFKCTKGGQVAHGSFILNYENDPELSLMYSFSNSYDKSLRFRAAVGARILLNGAYMIAEADSWKRKHTGTADNEMENLIASHLSSAGTYFNNLVEAKNAMKKRTIDMNTFGSIIGELFIRDLLTVDQISVVKKEYETPSYDYPDGENNLWTCYNHIINSLKTAHPKVWMHNQIAIHMYFCARFDLITYDKEVDSTEIVPLETVSEIDDAFVLPGFETEVVDTTEPVVEKIEITEAVESVLDEELMLPNLENNDFSELDELPELPMTDVENPNVVEEKVEEEIIEETVIVESEEVLQETVAEVESEDPNNILEEIVEDKVSSETVVTEEVVSTVPVVYFPISSFEGLNIGDTFEESGDYYNVLSIEKIEGEEYYVCNKLSFETSESVETTPEIVEPEIKTEPEEISSGNELPEEPVIPEEPEVKPEPKTVLETGVKDAVYYAISEEIAEIYGSPQEFTYVRADNQYNIKLVTGESITLSTSYIDAKL